MLDKICRGRVQFSLNMLNAFFSIWRKNIEGKAALVNEFERKFAAYIGGNYAISTASAKTALYLSLQALGAREGDEIIVPAYTVREVIDVIIILGLVPVFVDINLKDANIDAELIEDKISNKTRFVLMTHIYGCPCDVAEILKISRKYNLVVVEDAAQAFGGEYKLKKTGSFGKVSYFSFGSLKNLNTLGGGIIVTNDCQIAQFLRKKIEEMDNISSFEILRRLCAAVVISFFTLPKIFSILVYPVLFLLKKINFKTRETTFKLKSINSSDLKKYNVKFSSAQAAMGLTQMANIDAMNNARINNAKILNENLKDVSKIKIFKENADKKNIYLNYVIRVQNRNKFVDDLFSQGFDVSPGQVICCADQEDFKEYYCDCPMSRKMQKENIYMPIYSPLNVMHMHEIAAALRGQSDKK